MPKLTVGKDRELIMELRSRGAKPREIASVLGYKPNSVAYILYDKAQQARVKERAERNARASAAEAASEALMAVAVESPEARVEKGAINLTVHGDLPADARSAGAICTIPLTLRLNVAVSA